MLFNSYIFLVVFLPLTAAGYHLLGALGRVHAARIGLVVCSFYFYAWWNPAYLGLILFSIALNYAIGWLVGPAMQGVPRRALMILGIAINLSLLGYFKYANFFIDTLNAAVGTSFVLAPIVLPLAISFFTFQQIAYVVDAYRGETLEHSFLDYCLFVTFFPQLIAGPIVHHKEMLPQFSTPIPRSAGMEHLSVGLTIFVIGLFKKVIVADTVAGYATPVFTAALGGQEPALIDAWIGALAYTFQLYFDFSGYSDMAIGLGRMFGIVLPLNFDSPYKAGNIIEFWRRWHMTLSRFLRDYLYIALGGNRYGTPRRYRNLMITMLLGGLWHGAAWTFVLWGGLHGAYLVINHGWHAVRRYRGLERPSSAARIAARSVTFLAVVVGWVFFRAESFPAAWRILGSMVGLGGAEAVVGIDRVTACVWIAALLAAVNLLPNTQEILAGFRPAVDFDPARGAGVPAALRWRLTPVHAAGLAFVTVVCMLSLSRVSEFLYYQF